MKRISYFLLAVLSLVSISCERKNLPDARPEKSIVILSDNDVHCSIDGYTRLAGLYDAVAASDTAWAAVVSCGDYLQGGNAGALSRGQYIVDVMKAVGYDAVTLLTLPWIVYLQAVAGTGNTRMCLRFDGIALAIYTVYCILVIGVMKADIAVCWTADAIYQGCIWLLCALYIHKGAWKDKDI
ncbi:MAG: hypothetical protein J6T35_05925 [Bacteroidales bacterium]|nr:hypothetical protein [Bacteroidales bacterium]